MTAVLVDTSVLMRLVNALDPGYATARHAVAELQRLGHTLFLSAKNLIEFRSAATRRSR